MAGPISVRARRALLVLGMHRSGTSAVTGLLERLGARGPRTRLPPDGNNPLGYGESAAVLDLNDRLLQSAGTRWDAWTPIGRDWHDSSAAVQLSEEARRLIDQEFGDAPLIVVKDPRICRLVPFWLRAFEGRDIDPAAVIVVRAPLEVAASLAARDGAPREHALLLWLRHVLDAERETRQIRRSLVRYTGVLRDWKATAGRIAADLGLHWPDRAEPADREIERFLVSGLRHHAIPTTGLDLNPTLAEWVTKTDQALDRLLEPDARQARDARETLDAIGREFDRATSALGPAFEGVRSDLESERAALQQHASTLEQRGEMLAHELAAARLRVDALLASASWRLTAPLRAAWRILRRDKPSTR